jgi:hypothetical protein
MTTSSDGSAAGNAGYTKYHQWAGREVAGDGGRALVGDDEPGSMTGGLLLQQGIRIQDDAGNRDLEQLVEAAEGT